MIGRLILVCCLLCYCVYMQAQDSEPKERKNELGYDILPLVGYVFGGNITGLKTFNYRRHLGKWALRTRVGASYRNEKDDNDNDSTYLLDKNYNHLITLGLERNNVIKGWFEVHYGFEFTNRIVNSSDNSANTINGIYRFTGNESDITSVGVSFFLGFGIRINDRLRLITETRHETEYSFGDTRQISDYQSSSLNNYTEEKFEVEDWDVSYYLPNFLVLSFSF